ncbi:MAG TPA: hypothetical protein VMO24_03180, partial [Woeseiaceae bacterium]|nr:hypothetical protein [Woeseiaceae bacterium]
MIVSIGRFHGGAGHGTFRASRRAKGAFLLMVVTSIVAACGGGKDEVSGRGAEQAAAIAERAAGIADVDSARIIAADS